MTEVSNLSHLTKAELIEACNKFGVDHKPTMTKDALIAELLADGVTLELINDQPAPEEDPEPPVEDAEENAPVEDEADLVLVRMVRANNTYQIRGYTFTMEHPYALVSEKDADYLIEVDRGFRMASPAEARSYYS